MRDGNPYWHHVSLIYDQLQGLEDGYDAKIQAIKMVGYEIWKFQNNKTLMVLQAGCNLWMILFILQIQGKDAMVARIPHGDIFFMNIFGDLEDLTELFKPNNSSEKILLRSNR